MAAAEQTYHQTLLCLPTHPGHLVETVHPDLHLEFGQGVEVFVAGQDVEQVMHPGITAHQQVVFQVF